MVDYKNEMAKFQTENLLTGRTQIDATPKVNEDDFTIGGDNTISLKNKTSYLSIPGTSFISDTGANAGYDDGAVFNANGTIYGFASINLPQGAIVTEAIVYGSDPAETWALLRQTISGTGAGTGIATANINTTDTTISNPKIDNSTYKYYILTSELDTNDFIYGARITYTTDYD
jgi:hypothetical protein